MVRGWTAAICIFSASTATAVEAASSIDIGAAAKSWAPQFVLTGTKTEPTYVEHIRLERDGALFVLQGGAPAGMPSSREVVVIDADGSLRHIECPAAMRCDNTEPPSGFLASAAIVAAIGHGRLSGFFQAFSYGSYRLVCVSAEKLGVREAILDPCVEIRSGAVMALRHRMSGQFEGPSLDPWSINISTRKSAAAFSANQ
jgi:hypothetical protein